MDMLSTIKFILEYEHVPYEVIDDLGVIMKFKRGCVNPSTAVGVYAYPKSPQMCTIITNFYEAVKFIETHGLKQI